MMNTVILYDEIYLDKTTQGTDAFYIYIKEIKKIKIRITNNINHPYQRINNEQTPSLNTFILFLHQFPIHRYNFMYIYIYTHIWGG